jgi:hypothetical protein
MYFLNLKAFHPASGINTDNHGKYPFISSVDGLFEPDDYEFNYKRNFPFERINLPDDRVFYVSEPNLTRIFKNTVYGSNPIIRDNEQPIDEHYTNELATLFYNGYLAGTDRFYGELGQTYLSLTLDQKKEALRDFISYCHINLYFEGFAIPEVLYALGYLQANLVRGFQEYKNLQGLKEQELVPPIVKVYPIVKMPEQEAVKPQETEVKAEVLNAVPPVPEPEILTPQLLATNPPVYIPLKYPATAIFELWCALLDKQLCQLMQVPQVFFVEKEIKELLGRLFEAEGQEPLWLMVAEPQYYEMAPGYQNLLCLLMHATYKLNTMYVKVPQVRYCELLKSNFSSFDTIESVNDIKSNMTKKKDTAINFVHKSSGSYAKKAYKVLKKVPTYILIS